MFWELRSPCLAQRPRCRPDCPALSRASPRNATFRLHLFAPMVACASSRRSRSRINRTRLRSIAREGRGAGATVSWPSRAHLNRRRGGPDRAAKDRGLQAPYDEPPLPTLNG